MHQLLCAPLNAQTPLGWQQNMPQEALEYTPYNADVYLHYKGGLVGATNQANRQRLFSPDHSAEDSPTNQACAALHWS
jgi:hypothetical protein